MLAYIMVLAIRAEPGSVLEPETLGVLAEELKAREWLMTLLGLGLVWAGCQSSGRKGAGEARPGPAVSASPLLCSPDHSLLPRAADASG